MQTFIKDEIHSVYVNRHVCWMFGRLFFLESMIPCSVSQGPKCSVGFYLSIADFSAVSQDMAFIKSHFQILYNLVLLVMMEIYSINCLFIFIIKTVQCCLPVGVISLHRFQQRNLNSWQQCISESTVFNSLSSI